MSKYKSKPIKIVEIDAVQFDKDINKILKFMDAKILETSLLKSYNGNSTKTICMYTNKLVSIKDGQEPFNNDIWIDGNYIMDKDYIVKKGKAFEICGHEIFEKLYEKIEN